MAWVPAVLGPFTQLVQEMHRFDEQVCGVEG